jgi:hypothetical protein
MPEPKRYVVRMTETLIFEHTYTESELRKLGVEGPIEELRESTPDDWLLEDINQHYFSTEDRRAWEVTPMASEGSGVVTPEG